MPPKLSSGILGMKFMRKEGEEIEIEEEKPKNKFEHTKDPSEWVFKPVRKVETKTTSVSFNDLYGDKTAEFGRKKFTKEKKRKNDEKVKNEKKVKYEVKEEVICDESESD